MAPVKAKLRPKNEATRSIRQDERATTKFVNHDNDDNNGNAFRTQYLGARFGLPFNRAALIASLAFGEAAHV